MSRIEIVSELCFRFGATIGGIGILISFSLMVSAETFGTDYNLVTIGLPIAMVGLILMGIGALIEAWS